MRDVDGGEERGVPGTHRSSLQTGGRKEARFSSTQEPTLTGRVMATPGALPRERYSERCLGTVGGARLPPAAYWQPR